MPNRSNSVELFTKKISDYMSDDYLYLDSNIIASKADLFIIFTTCK